jgi:hypothetical protein
MSFTEDPSAFFYDFGRLATVGGASVQVIFDNAYAATLGFTTGTTPVILCAAADVPAVAQGDAVTVADGSYTVSAVEPDGTGMVLLRLDSAT